MIPYEIHSYNGIITIIIYTTNIISLHEPLIMTVLHYVNYVCRVYLVMRSYHSLPILSEKYIHLLF